MTCFIAIEKGEARSVLVIEVRPQMPTPKQEREAASKAQAAMVEALKKAPRPGVGR